MKLDLQNIPCPGPVVSVKENYEKLNIGDELEIIVNDEVAKQNIERLLNTIGQSFDVNANGAIYTITLKKSEQNTTCAVKTQQEVLLLKSLKVGEGELGEMLFCGFLSVLKQRKIHTIIMINEWVKALCDENHQAFNTLKELEEMGIKILACGNCLGYFKLEPKIGIVSNAFEIVDILFNSKVVSL